MIKLLAISGSLRRFSSNTALLRAASTLAPANVKISMYEDLGSLLLFNPDLEGFEPPSVIDFRSKLRMADGVLIASPEYAHGITGALKNALDWVVGSGEFAQKPVALLNASFRAVHAQESLREILKTMDADIVPEASKTIPLPNNKFGEKDIIGHTALSSALRLAVEALVCSIKKNNSF
ncbi:MAG: NAD(P)H-dependent oxidoreductase [Chlamydiales bacterium]|nr:NAD(P)H-dependent oxidoreductase [Chlamydiales bacterium]